MPGRSPNALHRLHRLHRLLRELIPGGAPTDLSSRQAAALLRHVQPGIATDTARKQLTRDLIIGLRGLEARIKTLTDQLAALVAQSGSTLTEIRGVGAIVAAKIIGRTGDVARPRNTDHFASLNGTAPSDASSGDGLTSMPDDGSDHTVITTADFVRQVDDLQYGLGEGPRVSPPPNEPRPCCLTPPLPW